MKFHLIALMLVGCAEVDSVAPPHPIALAGGCDEWGCGMNSPVIDGIHGFHDLNVNGIPNNLGYMILDATRSPYASHYSIAVKDGEFVLTRQGGSTIDPATIKGLDVVKTDITIGLGGSPAYVMHIVDAADDVAYWAKTSSTNTVMAYAITYSDVRSPAESQNICHHPPKKVEWQSGMKPEFTVVFEGERIDAGAKTIDARLDPSWFNLGCAQSTLAKLDLTGHTQAAKVAGFSTTIKERQTMLKMLSGDYCGFGVPFTVAGQPLEWGDDRGTLTIPQPAVVEAYWTPDGATCLNTARVSAHGTALGTATFPGGVESYIKASCPDGKMPRSCPATASPPVHLTSANTTPFSP